MVLLEDLACHFGLRTQEAINRLQSLQEMGRVTGTELYKLKLATVQLIVKFIWCTTGSAFLRISKGFHCKTD